MVKQDNKKRASAETPSRRALRVSKANRLIIWVGMASSFVLCTIMSFFDPATAVLSFGFTGMGFYLLHDRSLRLLRDSRIFEKIDSLQKDQTELAQELKKVRSESREVIKSAQVRDEREKQMDRSPFPQVKASAVNQNRKIPSVLSVAVTKKGGQKKAKSPVNKPEKKNRTKALPSIANDELLAYFDSLSDTVIKELIHHAVRNQSINVFVQPIVRLPQRSTRYFEMFARIRARPGLYVPASRYISVARKESVLTDIDQLLLMQCLKTIRATAHLTNATPFFLNITAGALKNKTFMKELLSFLSDNRSLAERLVFEIRQKDMLLMTPPVLKILEGLGKLGCALSIDHVKQFQFNIPFLKSMNVRFLKIDAGILMKKAALQDGPDQIMSVKDRLLEHDIEIIVEKVETERTLREILDFEINYGQGFLFGKPDLQSVHQKTAKRA